ncbi:MAG: aldolase [Leptospiraceae bacterium]|nr:aldolase [Leptospiraceae bacterium]MCP5503073.1 aldolase [Leptospiraceae bacterium]
MRPEIESELVKLKKDLEYYKNTYGFYGLKGGTETEDMDYEELSFLKALSKDIMPLKVKIGGVEARTDIRFCHSVHVNSILAPMVESEYALRNFVQTLKALIPRADYEKIRKSINLETITGYRNIMEIVDSKFFEELDDITAARSDLSASMNLVPDDPEVMRVTSQIVKISRSKGKGTCVGGTITRQNFAAIAEGIVPDMINSRHIIVNVEKAKKVGLNEVPEAMLEFEMDLFSVLGLLKPEKHYYYNNRIELNRERLGKKKVLYSLP